MRCWAAALPTWTTPTRYATASDAATDKRTTASITADEDLTLDNLETATLTVNVKNGGQAQGPTDYM